MTRAHARSALKCPDFYANRRCSSVFSYALLQIELGSFNRYALLGNDRAWGRRASKAIADLVDC
jgi:hypothetical protein